MSSQSGQIDHEEGLPVTEPVSSTMTPLLDPTVQQEAVVETESAENAPPPPPPPVLVSVKRYAKLCSHVLAVLLIGVVYAWVVKLGGLAWRQPGQAKRVFNWHPLLMTAAFSFMTVAALAFQKPSLDCSSSAATNRNIAKLLHASAWTVAALCAVLALCAVVQSHNDPVSGLIANLYSLHSWMGVLVMMLYIAQFTVGVRAFGGPILANRQWSASTRAWLLRMHAAVGPLVYFGTGVTLLLGIQEKEGFVGCGYHVDSPDLFPPQHWNRIPSSCLVSHALGLLIALTMMTTGIAWTSLE